MIGYIFSPKEAYVSFTLGNTLGVILGAFTHSLFLFVAIGTILVRPIQLFILVQHKKKVGFLGASFLALMFEVFVATGIGLLTYGSGGTMSSFSVFDAVYILPAYLALRLKTFETTNETRNLGYVAVVVGTFTTFVSASAFMLPISLMIGITLLFGSALIIFRSKGPTIPVLRKGLALSLVVVVIIASSVSVFATQPEAGYALRANFYPLFPDSLSQSQWIQTWQAAGCRQGNLAGGGTTQTGVWGPQRLRVMSTCVTVSGVIVALSPTSGPATDGDYGIDLKLDPPYTYILSIGNYALHSGYLHVEIVPVDQPFLSGLNLKPGDHIMVSGVWVLDTDHGWGSEIHPVWSITVLQS